MTQFELAKWLTRKVGENKATLTITFAPTCVVVDLDTPTALVAVELCAKHRSAIADVIVYAIALTHEAILLTCDRHFEDPPNVRFVSKSSR